MAYLDPRPHELVWMEAVIFRLASAYFSDGLVGFAFTLTMLVAGMPLFGLLRRGPAPAPR